ncbi:MAG: hypothetical protein KGS72_23820 [Cyanobacteria bacterium REEB67]|nr:hypothetical protein [Cyanobacteria bacterium REEB67]
MSAGDKDKKNRGPKGSYGSGLRAQVFEVIVRQGLAGAPWREICAAPMSKNAIDPEEVQAEIDKRRGDTSSEAGASDPKKPKPSPSDFFSNLLKKLRH